MRSDNIAVDLSEPWPTRGCLTEVTGPLSWLGGSLSRALNLLHAAITLYKYEYLQFQKYSDGEPAEAVEMQWLLAVLLSLPLVRSFFSEMTNDGDV